MAREGNLLASLTWGPSVAGYPLNIQLTISSFHLLDGDVLPGSKLLFPFFLSAILLAAYSSWRRAGHSDVWAGVLILAVGTVPLILDHSTTGYTNLPFSAYLILGCLMVLEGAQCDNHRQQLLGGLLLAGAVWTRQEGLLVVALAGSLLMFLVAPLGNGQRRAAAVLLPPAVVECRMVGAWCHQWCRRRDGWLACCFHPLDCGGGPARRCALLDPPLSGSKPGRSLDVGPLAPAGSHPCHPQLPLDEAAEIVHGFRNGCRGCSCRSVDVRLLLPGLLLGGFAVVAWHRGRKDVPPRRSPELDWAGRPGGKIGELHLSTEYSYARFMGRWVVGPAVWGFFPPCEETCSRHAPGD